MSGSAARDRAAPFLAGVFLVCMCSLMLQIVQTRLISVIVFYHLAFFAISTAMLGLTIGSLIVYFKSELFSRERLLEHLAWISAAFGIAIVLSTLSLITTIISAGGGGTQALKVVMWFKLIAILIPPYVLAGMAISLALTRSPWPVGTVYGVDLLGAATGCLATLVLLSWADAISGLFAVAALAALASLSFGVARDTARPLRHAPFVLSALGERKRAATLAGLFAVAAIANAAMQPTTQASAWRHGLVLPLAKDELRFDSPAVARWNTYSRINAAEPTVGQPRLWGPSPITPRVNVSQRELQIDGSAGTAMYAFDGDLSKLDFLRYDITNLAYTIRNQGRSAVIGVGGGRDLLSSYLFGFRDVTGVELNPIFVDLLTDEFRDYNRLADLPGVRFVVDEARSWFARTDERFDLIQMSLIDTWAATGAGAYSLSENGLYTTEAWQHFLSALTPTGVFTVSRWFSTNDITETGRLISLAANALRDHGIDDVQAHLFLAVSDRLATLIVSNAPLAGEDIAKLRMQTESLGFDVVLSPDDMDRSQILAEIAGADTAEALAEISARVHLDLSATTDDRPFFFNQLMPLDPESIALATSRADGVVRGNGLATMTLLLIVVLSGMLVVYTMLVPTLPTLSQAPAALARMGTFYFLLIGLGFMFVEIGLIQRISIFLGHPVYGMAFGLFGIIVSTGAGALFSDRIPLASGSRIVVWATALGLYLALLPFWLPVAIAAFEGSSLVERAVLSLAVVAPCGFLMGFGFPAGMRLVNAIDSTPTPWFWAVNGAAGVLAASLAVATSIAFSINASLWVGAVCYLAIGPVGMALVALSRRPSWGSEQHALSPSPASALRGR